MVSVYVKFGKNKITIINENEMPVAFLKNENETIVHDKWRIEKYDDSYYRIYYSYFYYTSVAINFRGIVIPNDLELLPPIVFLVFFIILILGIVIGLLL